MWWPFVAPPRALEADAMKSYRQELWFDVPGCWAFINITRQVEQCLHESGIH
jgi:hypothetical protein